VIGKGEHHEPFRSHGGTDEDTWALCRKCHNDRHLNIFSITILGDGKLEIRERNGKTAIVAAPNPLSEEEVGELVLAYPYTPAMTLRDAALRLPYCEDRVLAQLWARGTERTYEGQALEALAARAFRMRYGQYGQNWYSMAARFIADETGERVSAATVYDRYALAIALDACAWDLPMLRKVGPAALSAAGKVCDVPAAVERVRELREDQGLTARDAIKIVRQDFQTDEDSHEPLPQPDWEPCTACGGTGRVRSERKQTDDDRN
jgi:hypothetical protein